MTIQPVSMQELLDWNWARFGDHPERQAINSRGACRYRLEDPSEERGWRGCAIGHWLPDGVYTEHMEERSIDVLLHGHLYPGKLDEQLDPLRAWLAECDVDFLRRLQEAHDNDCHEPGSFRAEIARLAAIYNLKDPTEA